jgi:stage IV sporulation protein B
MSFGRGCGAMNYKQYRRCLIGLLLISLAGLGVLGYEEIRDRIPDSYTQTEGEPSPVHSDFFITEEIIPGLTEASVNAYASEGYTIAYKLLGIIPLKEARVEVIKPTYVIPGGVPIGIYMETEGVLIIGTGEVTGMDGLNYEPAYRIVQRGDYIQAVNGQAISDKEELIEAVNAGGNEDVVLDLDRGGEQIQVKVEAVQTAREEYKLGIWVRDNTQGIGTLTFLTEDGKFGALGHGVNDVDTGTLLEISEGALYDTNIIDIKKGEKGTPGELSGLIRYRQELICGQLTENTPVGIFGTGEDRIYEKVEAQRLQVGYKQEIELGEAFVRSAVSGEVKDYQVEILEVHRKDEDMNKGIILKVTDPELLNLTGGIVQGMSGSPIIQNGKLVGAVTHVFVQDSTKGFGVFIENMLEHVSL